VIAAIARAVPAAEVTVFDHGRGSRPARARLEGGEFPYRRRGGYHTRRFHRPESLWQLRVAIWLGWLGGVLNGGARAIAGADAVLDISGGDSFSDIYGPQRFRSICLGKLATLEARRPLVLLPQTYGPYESAAARRLARDIVRRAAVAWARDDRSFASLAELLGDELDPARHRSGVDVAFGLPAIAPAALPDELDRWLTERGSRPVAGVNVSGLLHAAGGGADRYGLRGTYEPMTAALVRRLVAEGARVVLVPHVVGGPECDAAACRRVLSDLGAEAHGAVLALDGDYDASGAKWLIGQLDFFAGTRMHSCIAALSSGVPAAGLAYSKKTLGVFESCGQGDAVPDLRSEADGAVVDRVAELFRERERRRTALAAARPGVVAAAQAQMEAILGVALGGLPERRDGVSG
jgi:polysaccharide pyruvyl transferase WcaK-like protein